MKLKSLALLVVGGLLAVGCRSTYDIEGKTFVSEQGSLAFEKGGKAVFTKASDAAADEQATSEETKGEENEGLVFAYTSIQNEKDDNYRVTLTSPKKAEEADKKAEDEEVAAETAEKKEEEAAPESAVYLLDIEKETLTLIEGAEGKFFLDSQLPKALVVKGKKEEEKKEEAKEEEKKEEAA